MTGLFKDLPTQTAPRAFPLPDNASTRAWKAAVGVLTGQGGMTERRARIYIGGLVRDGLRIEDLQTISESAIKAGTLEPVSYFRAAATNAIRERRPVHKIDAPEEARMRAWMEDYRENPASWRHHERGPAPGEFGCVVPDSLQREYLGS